MNLNNEQRLEFYRTMYRIRAFELKLRERFLAGELTGFPHLYVGEEAVATGVCANLTPKDMITSTHRGHGHCIAKGGRPDRMFAEIYGKEAGYCNGRGGSMHICSPELGILGSNGIVGAGMPIAVGAAFQMKYEETGAVAVTFFGDGASDRGTFHESLNLASTWKLPVLYVCENNRVALTTRQELHQNIEDISVRAAAYGIEGVNVDGNDILEVYEVAGALLEKIRAGGGPALLECKTWRPLGHFVGDPILYFTKEENDAWKAPDKDPIPRFATRLQREFGASEETLEQIRAEVDQEIEDAVAFAAAAPYPELAELTRGAYVEY